MKRSRNDQLGFGVVGIILIILAMGLVGGTLWYVFEQNRPKTSDAVSNETQDQNKNNNLTKEGKPEATVSYLEIKEWGVKLPLGESIKDAFYVSAGPSGGPGTMPVRMWLAIEALDGDKCDPNNNNRGGRGAIGAILRFPPDERDGITGELLVNMLPNGTEIGEYYYAYQSGARENPCATEVELKPFDLAFAHGARNITRSSETE